MNIFESINKIMGEVGAIGKNSKNDQQKFMYRGIDAVMNALNPALINNKVFVVPTVLEQTREERESSRGGNLIYSICKIKFTFYAEDGSSVEAVTIGEGMDSGDKATNKAMSVAFKYACFQVFCIPTEELLNESVKLEDPDKESHDVKPKKEPQNAVNFGKDPGEIPLGPGLITGNQKAKLMHEINRTKVDINEVCGRYKVNTIDDLPAKYFENLFANLQKLEDR